MKAFIPTHLLVSYEIFLFLELDRPRFVCPEKHKMLPEITISSNFKRRAWISALSIVLFAFVFLLLLIVSVYLTWYLGVWGYKLIVVFDEFHVLILILGIGMVSLGIMILIFLLKFIFKTQETDRSEFIEITKAEEPEIFNMITEVVEIVQTDYPKHVYIVEGINASVFYDSSFLSLFLPVRKNLCIGIGLLNSTTKCELMGVLAHEFGHFSQKSMRLASYVHQVNHIVYDLLYEDENYFEKARDIASYHFFIAIFIWSGIYVIKGIQWVLLQMFRIVNFCYLSLSREMEYHADEVSANVVGSKARADVLLRYNFAQNAYNEVLNFYHKRIFDAQIASDIFEQHRFVMFYLGQNYSYQMKGKLPVIPIDVGRQFNPFKLYIEDQWSSHPSIEDRVDRLSALNLQREHDDNLAFDLVMQYELYAQFFTQKIFEGIEYNRPPNELSLTEFVEAYKKDFEENSLPDLFKEFFDYRNIANVAFEEIEKPASEQQQLSAYFGEDTLAKLSEFRGLTTDLNSLDLMMKGEIVVDTFEYDGRKYRKNEKEALSQLLKLRFNQVQEELAAHELDMLRQAFAIAKNKGEAAQFREKYEAFAQFDRDFELEQAIGLQMHEAVQFMHVETLKVDIMAGVQKIKALEPELKAKIAELRRRYSPFWVSNRLHAIFNDFNDANNQYFNYHGHYFEKEAHQLFEVIDAFFSLFTELYFKIKQDFLRYLAGLAG
jgi:Zn-dependent protease with chaperone function